MVYHYGWPKDENAFENAAAIVMYCDGGAGHMDTTPAANWRR